MTTDYSIQMRDSKGRTCVLCINGASIDEQIASGTPEWEARENVEGNSFANAIHRGEIGDDALLVAA
jgi:hypothetical protein